MEPLFRLTLVRPPVEQDPAHPSIELSQESPYQVRLAAALEGDDKRDGAVSVSRDLITCDVFVVDPDALDLGAGLSELSARLDVLDAGREVSHPDVVEAVRESFGADPGDLVGDDRYRSAVSRLRDSIVAVKYVQEEHRRPLHLLAARLRDLEVVARVAADQDFPADAQGLRRHRGRSLQLPTRIQLASVLSTAKREAEERRRREAAEKERRTHVAGLLATYRGLHAALAELTRLHGGDLAATAVEEQEGVQLPDELRPQGALVDQRAFGQKISALTLRQLERARPAPDEAGDPQAATTLIGVDGVPDLARTSLVSTPALLAGKPAFRPPEIADIAFRVVPAAAGRLSEDTRSVLDERGLDLADRPLDRVVSQLRAESEALSAQLDGFFSGATRTSVKRVGGTLVTISTPRATAWTDVLFGGGLVPALDLVVTDARIPHTRGDVSPAGIADLLIVKQQLIGYEATDVAHVENVLKGERKVREHSSRRETEQITFSESELTTSEERELESTSRFELTRETSSVIKEDAALKAGLAISGKYGPTVEFSASAEGSVSRSKEEATQTAASFSQDVTERSSRRVTERVLERSSLRITDEVLERNEHTLDNVGGGGHVSGVYQWVNKVYQAQMFNYGLRTMFDFMVPEPAAMLIGVMRSAHASETTLSRPAAFTLQPNQVSEGNYGHWVRLYGATDVTPPPDVYTTVSHHYSAGGGDDKTDYNHSAQLTVPAGYAALQGTVGIVSNTWEQAGTADVVLGRRTQRIGGGVRLWSTSLDDERGSLPFALNTWRFSDIAVAVEVKCQRTPHAMTVWAADTHAKLTTAHAARLAEYEEQLSQLQLQAGIAIEGQNPAANLELMRDELKKHCLSILTDQHFDLFDAVDTGGYGFQQVDVHEAAGEGAYVRFFEQAWEWEHMTWVTYPYFWGRKAEWDERVAYEDPDPLFNQFLKSGYCRVSVPARPGFEGAIDHFMSFGELWNGGPLPAVSSPLYLPIADEIAERLDRPGTELPQGEPWEVRVPTTLVKLRPDDSLPRWEQAADGSWHEA